MLTSSTQLQNKSFHVVERTRTSSKCQKMKNARAKRAKILFFVVKHANFWGFCYCRRHGCLIKLPSNTGRHRMSDRVRSMFAYAISCLRWYEKVRMFTDVSALFICQILFRDWGNPAKVLYLFVTKCDLLSLVTVAKLFCSYSSALSCNTHSLTFFIQNTIHKHFTTLSHIFATMNLYVSFFLIFLRKSKVLAKRLQHFNATTCNIVGHNMLHMFGQPVACWLDHRGVCPFVTHIVKGKIGVRVPDSSSRQCDRF